MGLQVVEHPLGAVSVADVGAEQSRRPGLAEDRHRPLRRDQRLVVGRGEDRRVPAPGERDELRRRDLLGQGDRIGIPDRLRGDPVLAVGAVEVAAEHPE